MKKLAFLVSIVLCFSVATVASDDDPNTFKARLRGLGEAPPVATQASGSFTATLSSDGTTLSYTVTYANLNAQVIFSHIHFGFTKEVGGFMVFLCGPRQVLLADLLLAFQTRRRARTPPPAQYPAQLQRPM